MELRVCAKCRIHHYENCPNCYGFGMYVGSKSHLVPVTAAEAHGDLVNWLKEEMTPLAERQLRDCPVCGSSSLGLPVQLAEGI